jgi:oligopeptide transport system substrate-binding protein
MTGRVINSSLRLEKNDLYWDADNSFPTNIINFLEIKDENTQIAMFESGEVDAIANLPAQYNEYLSNYLYRVQGTGVEFIWINQNGTTAESARLLSNLNFRKALSYGLNRQEVTLAVNNANEPANSMIVPNFLTFNGNRFIDEYPVDAAPLAGDVEQARGYLQKAMDELGYTNVSALPFFSMVTFPTDTYKRECEIIIDQWKRNLGIENVRFAQYEVGIAIEAFFSMDYDFFCISWEPDVRPTDIMQAFMTGGDANPGIWSNSGFDSLLGQAIREKDVRKQEELVQRAHQIFISDAGILPLYTLTAIHAVQNYVSGFKTGSIDGYEFNNLVVNRE